MLHRAPKYQAPRRQRASFRRCHVSDLQMRLSPDEIEHIALLSRLKLTDEERERMTTQLNDIIRFFEQLGELDTSDVPPTSHVIPMSNVLRADVVRPSLPVEDVLENAPDRVGDAFRVPRVVE
jgi:aspartyl-tRNA(Asn)/glutamyl-tRNA(Gln) amidotransferase subunit C